MGKAAWMLLSSLSCLKKITRIKADYADKA